METSLSEELEGILTNESTVYLTTIGRRTGRPHVVALWFTYAQGNVYVVPYFRTIWRDVDKWPDWAKNILKDVRVTLEIRGYSIDGVATIMHEREVLEAAFKDDEDKYGFSTMRAMTGQQQQTLPWQWVVRIRLIRSSASEMTHLREYVTPPYQIIFPGQSTSYKVHVTGPKLDAKLDLRNTTAAYAQWPSGLTYAFDPPSGAAPFASQLVVSTDSTTPTRTYTLAVGSCDFALHVIPGSA